MNKSKIDWTDYTWNPVTGCQFNCPYCFARRQSLRFSGDIRLNLTDERCHGDKEKGLYVLDKPFITREDRSISYPFGFAPTFHEYRLDWPGNVKNSANIFVCSMADLFGEWVPDDWIEKVFRACEKYDQHNYLFLTKNPSRLDKAIDNFVCEDRGSQDSYNFFSKFWFGTTVTSQKDSERISQLSILEEGHRFLSIEPLHGPVFLDLKKERCPKCGSTQIYQENLPSTDLPHWYCDCCDEWESEDGSDLRPNIDWVIIGAETGRRKGKISPKKEWVHDIVRQCRDDAGIPVFMKDSLRELMGKEFVQEFPPELLHKPISQKLKKKLWEPCGICGTDRPKKEMIALLYRVKRGEGVIRLGYACPECFSKLQAAITSGSPCEIKDV
ncbi:DUF5131 family protein [Desulfitobacterium sp. AusDCA]|uniref:DUF5131 family protein n=1 Tax=Desulfitobacterium sp. AusDCA TaxID=3240383 RepID=UPI003DA6CE8B